MKAHFVLSKGKVKEQYSKLKNLGVNVSYSVKTNKKIARVLAEEEGGCKFSVHNLKEIDSLGKVETDKIWYFSQAWSKKEIEKIIGRGMRKFVIDNEEDLKILLDFVKGKNKKIWLSLRMKFAENRIVTGKYFVYGFSGNRVRELIFELRDREEIEKLGVHVHRKSQNASEWNMKRDLEENLDEESLRKLDFINLGGGYPVKYRNFTSDIENYVFSRIKEVNAWLQEKEIETWVEPGRFISAPSIKLVTVVIQNNGENLVLNCSIYNSALDALLTGIRLLVEGELERNEKGKDYLLKGNTPTRDDIFRYRVRLKDINVEDKIVFLNAGAYNYKCDFCDLEELDTRIVD
jgi:ornithine decarboxylase